MKRRGSQALLLPFSALLLVGVTFVGAGTTTLLPSITAEVVKETTARTTETTTLKPDTKRWNTTDTHKPIIIQPEVTAEAVVVPNLQFDNAEELAKVYANPKEALMQGIRTLNSKMPAKSSPPEKIIRPILDQKDMEDLQSLDENVNDPRIQEAVAKVIKAEAQKLSPEQQKSVSFTAPIAKLISGNKTQNKAMSDLLQAEADVAYGDSFDEGEIIDNDDDDDEDDEDEDEDDVDDEDDDDDEYDDKDIEEEEAIMTQCPDYCRCSGQYAAATTARCSKIVQNQSFGPGIAHLRVENAGEIRLGPHALRTRSLQQLESITIVDTRVSFIDRTAFDGIQYLFAVNLSRNGIIDIHPDTFQNNTQLSLLTISGHPFWRNWTVNKNYLLDAESVTELDFSWNSMPRLPKKAFSKMPNLAYLNLKQNRLSKIEKSIFEPMDSLVELDLSANMLSDLPSDIFIGKGLQTLRIAENDLTTLETINASKLTILDASNNRIKIIAKDDLAGVPSLDQLVISWNGLKRIHQHAFAHLDQLDFLDISNNNLDLLTDHHLRNNPRLQILLMSDNPDLRNLPVFVVNGIYDSFSVYRLECANCGLEFIKDGTFNAMPALTRLNLARNRLTGLPKGLLEPLSSLRELDLSDNLISKIAPSMLYGAVTLTKLNLAGNPLVTLQVTPFLQSPGLARLDVSRCQLKRVWSEARQPLKSLRFMSLRGNELERITVEELKATPKLSGLDASHNPMLCDDEFNDAIEWLTSHGVTPMETLRYISNLGNADEYAESEGVSHWSDLAKLVCADTDGPPRRPMLHKPKVTLLPLAEDEEASEISKDDIEADIERISTLEHGQRIDENVEDAWLDLDNNEEYEDYDGVHSKPSVLRSWYGGPIWPFLTVLLVTLSAVLVIIQISRSLANRRGGRGPVIRPPMILRQGLVDNKNCGLVYKPLQEEIPTPHMPKRGSFYSSSTFHYDKIVPESV